MMKKILFCGVIALAMISCSHDEGTVTIQLPENFKEKNLVVSHMMVDNMFEAKSADDVKMMYDTLEVKDGVAILKIDPSGAARYDITPPAPTTADPEFYTTPKDNLVVTIKSFDPLEYEVKGSPLMDDMTAYLSATRPIQMEYINLVRSGDDITPEQTKEIFARYDAAIKQFVAAHPESHVLPLAITELPAEDFKEIYDKMTPEAKKSILMPFAEAFNKDVEGMLKEQKAEEQRKEEVASGKIVAPAFTLPDLEGKKVSLSDFRGKWVVLDFWGSWCGWCVKGFPALKEAYEKYGDKIVVIGIDCNESEADWRAGVKKHQIPWLNLYNGNDRALYEAYGIEGFPTKAIINPEGHLVDLTTGEDPTFYDRLAKFVK
ncbi:MAG: redoxin domain-containing protein [Muribaculaceae bacterium]|nr:redoxin domain-containing protein [Muribaculaceae bacterium]